MLEVARDKVMYRDRFLETRQPIVVSFAEELHPVSLMTQIEDVYDSLRTYRPYRPSLDLATALSILREGRGKEFDPSLFDNFLRLVA